MANKNVKDFAAVNALNLSTASILAIVGGELKRFTGQNIVIDSSGNVGIGITPTNRLTVSNPTDISMDAAGSGQFRIQGNGYSTAIAMDATGTFIYNNGSGRAMAFGVNEVERLRIDSSGNVGVGTTSPSAKLHIAAGSGTDALRIDANTGSNTNIAVSKNGSVKWYLGNEKDTDGFRFYDNTAAAERLRIDSSGNVGIGSASIDFSNFSSASQGLEIKSSTTYGVLKLSTSAGEAYLGSGSGNCWLWNFSNGYLVFATNNLERARIRNDGVVLFAKSTTALATVGYRFDPTGESFFTLSATANTTVTNAIYSAGASAYRFYVGLGGTVYATSTTISAISDVRLKENIRDLNVGLDSIMALKPRIFDWKNGKGQNIKNARGFIAQEIEQVFPDLVDEWKDPVPEGEEPYKSVRQDLIPIIVKALQELKLENDNLKLRIANLENS